MLDHAWFFSSIKIPLTPPLQKGEAKIPHFLKGWKMKFPPFSKGGEGGFVAGHNLTLPLLFLKNLSQDRHNLKEIAHNSIIAFIEDGGVLIRVHRHNDL